MQALFEADPVVLAWWAAELECISAIARLERDRTLRTESVDRSLARLDALAESWHEIQPAEQVRRTARRLLRVHALRAADSLQLAAALVAAEGHPESLELVSFDDRLADAARREGFPVLGSSR
ncbi:MAG: type II toxin-antitoxin system VapC family toxin [Gaiellaceae bacterium]